MSFSPLKSSLLAGVAMLGIAASAPAADPFSIILVPDTQYYTQHASYDIYDHQMLWISNNKTAYNIKFVVHLGDMTNNNTTSEWAVARAAHNILDSANVPYSVLPGNHDYKGTGTEAWHQSAFRDLARFNSNFGPQKFNTKPWYGGNKGNTTTNNENNYCLFEVGDLKFMVLSLEYAPRKDTMTWANNLISQHPDRRVIVATHGYMTTNGAYVGSASANMGMIGASGSELFDGLINRHSNVFLATCGHVTESVTNTKTGNALNTVYEMLVDYQGETPRNLGSPNLGNGWLRILTFDPDTNTIDASTISVEAGNTNVFTGGTAQFYETSRYAASYTAADHLFSLPYDMTTMQPYHYLNGSTQINEFTVNATGGGDQGDSDIASDANGNFVVVWEDDHDGNGVHLIRMRGFDPDGNVRFGESIVNTVGVNTTNTINPSIDMAADGRFVISFQTGTSQIKARVYNANGTATGAEITVPSTTGGAKGDSDVGIADNGDFVVAWEDDADANGSYQIRARGFTFAKAQKIAEFSVNTTAAGQQYDPEIGMASNGNFSVIWSDDQNNDGLFEVGLRGFNANGTQKYAQLFANSTTAGQQRDGDIAMDDSGRAVVVWEDDADGNNTYQLKARGFTATGTQQFAERTVNATAGGDQINGAVAMTPDGNSYIAWQDSGSGEGNQMMTQALSISGTNLLGASDIRANSALEVTNDGGAVARNSPNITVHKNGRYVVAWSDDTDGNGGFQILARGLKGQSVSLVTKQENGTVARSVNETFYKSGQSVTLTATPSSGYTFTRWYGDVPAADITKNPLTLVLNGNKRVDARFSSSGGPVEVIVDNVAPAFTASTNWTASSSTSGYYGTNYQFRSTAAVSDLALWNVNLPSAGNYTVYARWTAGGNRSATAPYQVYHNGGTTAVPINQQVNNGTWVSLGTYAFNAGASNKVGLSCWATSGFVVVADAVRFVKQ